MSTATDILELTAAQAIGRVKTGDLDPADLWSLYRERALADDLNAFTWVAGDETPQLPDGATLGGVPLGVKDLFATEGIPSQAGSRILQDYRPP